MHADLASLGTLKVPQGRTTAHLALKITIVQTLPLLDALKTVSPPQSLSTARIASHATESPGKY